MRLGKKRGGEKAEGRSPFRFPQSKIFHRLLAVVSCLVAFPLFSCIYPDPRGNLPDSSGGIPQQGDTSLNPRQYAAFVVTSDFSLSGGFAVISLADRSVYFPDPVWASQVVSPDPVATAFGDYVFIINRYTYDNISVLNKSFRLIRQYSVSDASCDPSNPHDLAFVNPGKAYLSRYECRDLWIINPLTGERLGAIDLAAAGYGGSDQIPEMSGLLLHGSTLYVAVQLFNRKTWNAEGPGRLILVDSNTDTVTGAVTLTGENPVTDLLWSDSLGRILIGESGKYSVIGDGGIETVNPSLPAAEGYLIDETTLGGNLSDFEILNRSRGFATITDRSFRSFLVSFNPAAGLRDPQPVYSAAAGFALWDIALNDRGELFLCDRNARAPGIIVVDAFTNQVLTSQPINLGLPPFSIVFMK